MGFISAEHHRVAGPNEGNTLKNTTDPAAAPDVSGASYPVCIIDGCSNRMRPRGLTIKDCPETTATGSRQRCAPCAARARLEPAAEDKPQETSVERDNMVVGLQAFMAARRARGNAPEATSPIAYVPSAEAARVRRLSLLPAIEYREPKKKAA